MEGISRAAQGGTQDFEADSEDRTKSTSTSATAPLTRAGVSLHEVYSDDRVRVVSDARLSQADAKLLAHKVEDFYSWDQRTQAWKDPAPLSEPLTVAALSRRTFSELIGDDSGTVGGFTTGPDLFVMPSDSAHHSTPDDDVVIAHELGHVQDFREAGRRIKEVPVYLQEGKAYLLGDEAVLAKGKRPDNVGDVTRALSRVTGAGAQHVMSGFRKASDEAAWGTDGFYGETVGALYVEYLRLHFKGGSPDALANVADLIAGVGQGEDYELAFKRRFGASSATAEAAFVKWMKDTEHKPQERLRGTIYEIG